MPRGRLAGGMSTTSQGTAPSQIVVLVGNPEPASRTRAVAEEVARRLAERTGATAAPTVDLADHAPRIFDRGDAVVAELLERVRTASVLVVASPTYKASYTGLLKAFLDRYPGDGLRGVVAVPLLTIGAPDHSLAVEHTLRPLLVELGASVPTRGIAFPTGRFDERETIVREWLDANGAPLIAALD